MPEEHRDIKSEIKQLILKLEEKENTLEFRIDEITDAAKLQGITEEQCMDALHDLEEDRYIHIHHARGGTDLVSRVDAHRDYSPAFEEFPEY